MIRLSLVAQNGDETLVKVEGQLEGADLAVLEREIGCRLSKGQHLVLDLEGVAFIDSTGLALLKRWVGKRLRLQGGSWFIRKLLESQGL